jgi:hypothetical protein
MGAFEWNKKSLEDVYGIEEWENRRGAVGEGREGGIKGGGGSMRAGGPLGLT